ncbi:hypothetical protein VNI00_014203 [Paramarasmius palmivorus]|uniref:Uncharacterized protein n=1 Tax=Paramarasmius palmivorus TaxID=297713 RepID=A0AAW0BV63_9AGAR
MDIEELLRVDNIDVDKVCDQVAQLNDRLIHYVSREMDLEKQVEKLEAENRSLHHEVTVLDQFTEEQSEYIERVKKAAREALEEIDMHESTIGRLEAELKEVKEDECRNEKLIKLLKSNMKHWQNEVARLKARYQNLLQLGLNLIPESSL